MRSLSHTLRPPSSPVRSIKLWGTVFNFLWWVLLCFPGWSVTCVFKCSSYLTMPSCWDLSQSTMPVSGKSILSQETHFPLLLRIRKKLNLLLRTGLFKSFNMQHEPLREEHVMQAFPKLFELNSFLVWEAERISVYVKYAREVIASWCRSMDTWKVK